jgi:CRP-like cAMP-binding protein
VVDGAAAARIGREVFLLSLSGDRRVLGWAFPRFVRALTDVYVAAGESVYREGEPADAQYFVVSGEVTLTRAGAHPIRMSERAVVGTLDMLLERPRRRTATAAVATHLLRMLRDDWWELIEDRLDLAQRIIGNLGVGIHALRARAEPLGGFEPPPPPPSGDPPRGLNLIERILVLRRAGLFSHASIQALTTLAELSTELYAPSDGGLVPQAATRGHLVVVAWGEVSASGRAPAIAGRFGQGTLVLGGAALDPNADYELTAAAPTVALTLSIEEYFDTMEEHFSVVRSTLLAVAQERDELLER